MIRISEDSYWYELEGKAELISQNLTLGIKDRDEDTVHRALFDFQKLLESHERWDSEQEQKGQ